MKASPVILFEPPSPRSAALSHVLASLADEVRANYSPFSKRLSVFGDDTSNAIAVSRTATGTIQVNNGTVTVDGATPTVANTVAIDILGKFGDDTITLNESLRALPAANIRAGHGADTVRGGSKADTIFGDQGDDHLSGEGGHDRFGWSAGHGSDQIDGGHGYDTLVFAGSEANERVSLAANGAWFSLTRDVGGVAMSLLRLEEILVDVGVGADLVTVGDLTGPGVSLVKVALNAGGTTTGAGQADQVTVTGTLGDDRIAVSGTGTQLNVIGLSAGTSITGLALGDRVVIDAHRGDDLVDAAQTERGLVLSGGDGDDVLIGGRGSDSVFAGAGTDTILMGAGDDRFVWDRGHGSDQVMGGAGTDTFAFNGGDIGERVALSATDGSVTFTRDVATVRTNLDEVERFDLRLSGGADRVEVADLAGSDLRQVSLDLAAAGLPDGLQDTIILRGTEGADTIRVTRSGDVVVVSGLGAATVIRGFDPTDRLVIAGMGGDDVIDATGFLGISLVLDGGAGADKLVGGLWADVLIGGTGTDVLSGGPGDDVTHQDTPSGWLI